ncbi:glycosyltransferase [Knoellia sp. DB2414S]|uniref:Glycosyltransferase n=1 Tax=Knoellia koreensis TaxID=2730921 RepID=A0A849H9G6_9MICO|nr:glycosyltransferase [Knoellia sp. DB2414S]
MPSVRTVKTPFSLLLPVYRGDRPDHLARAFQSTVLEQTRRPSEVVVVQDGQITAELASTLERLESSSPVPLRRLRLTHNVGLAQALQCGLSACSHEVIARMDADDISLPHRFELQIPLIEDGADLVGSALVEFGETPEYAGRERVLRVPPLTAGDIAAEARLRSPFNHPTVVYRRSAVLQAGGYRELPLLEDYWLFTRMISSGAKVANLAEPLVLYRVDSGSYQRRGGLRLLRSELGLQRRLHREGFTSNREHLRNLMVRGGYRVVPVGLRRAAYRHRFTTTQPGATVDVPTVGAPPAPNRPTRTEGRA